MPTTTRAAEFRTSKDLPLLRRTSTVAGTSGQVVIRHLNEEVVLENEAAHLFNKLRPELSGASAVAAIAEKVAERPARVRALLEQLEKAGVVSFQAGTNERSEEHTSELQSLAYLVCRLLLEKKKHR